MYALHFNLTKGATFVCRKPTFIVKTMILSRMLTSPRSRSSFAN